MIFSRMQTKNGDFMINQNIDGGRAFDWGKTSSDYAKYRDIYPRKFYEKLAETSLGVRGQRALDLGTGTGVVPRNMLEFGAEWVGTDASQNQIEQAKKLSEGMGIKYYVAAAEDIDFPEGSFDVVTACQCFWYFDHERLISKLYSVLNPNGSFAALSMVWLPLEDEIAAASEKLVLKYNPDWSGAGDTRHPFFIPKQYYEKFSLVYHEEFSLDVPFTRESWNGRIKACRGIGASLTEKEIEEWEKEHLSMLSQFPERFTIKHYVAIAQLKKI